MILSRIVSESWRDVSKEGMMQKLIRSTPEQFYDLWPSEPLLGVWNADSDLRKNMSIRRNLHSELLTSSFRKLNILSDVLAKCEHLLSGNILETVFIKILLVKIREMPFGAAAPEEIPLDPQQKSMKTV